MKILILGGTLFLGRHIAAVAVRRGHALTLFNRGRRAVGLFPEAEQLHGDRDADLGALRGRVFDCVIDTCGYRPGQLQTVAETLAGGAAHYIFISSISVYRSFAPGQAFDEDAPLLQGNEGYGALKARSEEAIEAALPGRVAHVRPGLIVGPQDPTGRFGYWPRRVARGGEVLAPGRPERPVHWIDVRDLAEWCVHLAEQASTGAFNAVGPSLSMQALLERCRAVTGSDARFTWLGDSALQAAGVTPWTELPLWIPEHDPAFGGMLLADNRRALQAGLRCRPVDDTIAAALDWEHAMDLTTRDGPTRVASLTPAREAELLAAARALQDRPTTQAPHFISMRTK